MFAHSILDRLSPAPEPEVDEATVWTRKVLLKLHGNAGYYPEKHFGFQNIRAVIAELIASKDGEIERLAGINIQLVAEHNAMNQDGARLESELATLRAENERLKKCLRRISELEYTYDGSDLENAKMIAEQATEPNTRCAYCGRYRWEADEKGSVLCNPPFTVQPHVFKAAERNPAEPEHRLSSEQAVPAGEVVRSPSSRSSDGSGSETPGSLRTRSLIPITDTAGVEVRQVDRDAAKALLAQQEIRFHLDGTFRDWDNTVDFLAAIRTEAEARGRREAFREVKHVLFQFEGALANSTNFQRMVDELKRIMAGGK